MKLLWRYLLGHRSTLALALFLATVNQVFSLIDPQIFRLIIDDYAAKAGVIPPQEFLRGVTFLLLGLVAVAFVSRVAKNFQDYYVNVVTQRVGARLYADSVGHSFSLPYAVFEDQRSGELLQKLSKARIDSQNFIASAINILFLSLVGIVFVLIYSFWVHWSVGLAYALVLPTIGSTVFLISKRIKAAQARIVAETAELAGATTETLRNVELVKSLGLEKQESDRLNSVNAGILGLELKKVKLVRVLSFIQGTIVQAVRTLILLLMLWLISRGDITLGEFFTLLFYSFIIFNPLGELGTVASGYQEARASLAQVEKVLAVPPEPVPEDSRRSGELRQLEFRNVSFAYGPDRPPALEKATFAITSGETLAFVGPSGSGKSTLLKLLVGLYRPTGGGIIINDIPAANIDYADFRRRIGYVAQETQLFAGTIRDNLLFVRPEASDADCLKALEQAAVMGIIERGGGGLDTKIGEGGIKISGGERQRLAIARALLRDPEIIIFDEATSSLDSMTERAITETIKQIAKLRPNLMTILVAHRLSTIAHADRIHVLERGRISEVGSHKELLEMAGLYSALWREQSSAGGA